MYKRKHKFLIEELPNEMIIKIFSFLDLKSLMECACVCAKWQNLSNSSSLWKSLYFQLLAFRLKSSRGRFEKIEKGMVLKAEMIKTFKQIRNKRFLHRLKINSYTGVTDKVDKIISKVGCDFQVVIEGKKDNEITKIEQSRRKVFSSSTFVQWYSMNCKACLKEIKTIKIYSRLPLVYDKDEKPVTNSPVEFKLVFLETLTEKSLKLLHKGYYFFDITKKSYNIKCNKKFLLKVILLWL